MGCDRASGGFANVVSGRDGGIFWVGCRILSGAVLRLTHSTLDVLDWGEIGFLNFYS